MKATCRARAHRRQRRRARHRHARCQARRAPSQRRLLRRRQPPDRDLPLDARRRAEGLGGELRVTGDLAMHGVSHPVTLEVEAVTPVLKDPWGNARRGVTARAHLSRKDWGLQWNLALRGRRLRRRRRGDRRARGRDRRPQGLSRQPPSLPADSELRARRANDHGAAKDSKFAASLIALVRSSLQLSVVGRDNCASPKGGPPVARRRRRSKRFVVACALWRLRVRSRAARAPRARGRVRRSRRSVAAVPPRRRASAARERRA